MIVGPDFDALEYMADHEEWDRDKFGDDDFLAVRNVKATEIQDAWRALKAKEK